MLCESSAEAWPTNVVPSRKLPAREETDSLQLASLSWRGDGSFFVSVTKSAAGVSSPLSPVILESPRVGGLK